MLKFHCVNHHKETLIKSHLDKLSALFFKG